MPASRTVRTFLLVALLIAAGLGVGSYLGRQYLRNSVPPPNGLLWPNPKSVQPFLLADQNGKPFGLQQLRGKWSFLYFGYSNCPDVCPMTLTVLDTVQSTLAHHSDLNVQTVFITVDPDRDTPEVLGRYLRNFNKSFIGLDGKMADIRTLCQQLGVVSSTPHHGKNMHYQVDHSASVFLIDPKGQLITIFSPPLDADAVLARFHNIREFLQRQAGA